MEISLLEENEIITSSMGYGKRAAPGRENEIITSSIYVGPGGDDSGEGGGGNEQLTNSQTDELIVASSNPNLVDTSIDTAEGGGA